MDPSSSLSLELTIIRARNINLKKPTSGELFVRCYLSAGNNRRIGLDSHEIPSLSADHLTWNQTFSLDCSGNQDSINSLRRGTLVFELRLRRRCSPFMIITGMNGSKLLGRAEIPWENVLDSPNMSMNEWVVMMPKNGCVYEDVKPPAVQIAMRVQECSKGSIILRETVKERKCDVDCGCSYNSFVDYELFAAGACLEAL